MRFTFLIQKQRWIRRREVESRRKGGWRFATPVNIMTKGWHRHRKEHRIARYKGLARHKSQFALKNSTPEEEKRDYQNLRPIIRERRDAYTDSDYPELHRYRHFSLPSRRRIQDVQLKISRIKNVYPIEVKVGDQLKVVDFKPTSVGMGGVFDHDKREITVDDRLMDAVDWTMRKGTIAHEFQHSVDYSEVTPSAVNNIVRQTLLQDFPNTIIVGTFDEINHLARRLRKRLNKEFIGKTPIILYNFEHNNKRYTFAKDGAWVSAKELVELSKNHKRPIQSINVGGKNYKYISFRFANVFGKN